MTEVTLIETVSADSLTQLLQDAGCRVNRSEQNVAQCQPGRGLCRAVW